MFVLREILLVALVAHCATSATIPSPSLLVKYGNLPVNFRQGAYSFIYTGDDGATLMERGEVKRNQDLKTYLAVTGTYTYKDQFGKARMIPYNSNEQGYSHRHGNEEPSFRMDLSSETTTAKGSTSTSKATTTVPPSTTAKAK